MPDVYKTVVTKSNLQYYHGKLKRQIDELGDVKDIKAGSESAYIDTDPTLNINASIRQGSFKGSIGINVQNNAKTLNYENENYPGAVVFEEKPTDGTMRISSFYSHAAYNREWTIYNKDSVDSKFTAINGLKFHEVDTNLYPTLESFLSKEKWIDTGGEEPQLEAGFWLNKIALYPSDGELLEYVLILSQAYPENGAWSTQDWINNANFEFIGSTKQDLTGYLKDGDLEPIDNDYIDAMYAMGFVDKPGMYSINGDFIKPWNDVIAKQGAGEYAFINTQTVSGATQINGRGLPWPSGASILVVPQDISVILSLNYTGPAALQEQDKISDLIGIVLPHPSTGNQATGIDIMSISDYENNITTPNLRWAAGDVTNASFVGLEIKTFQI